MSAQIGSLMFETTEILSPIEVDTPKMSFIFIKFNFQLFCDSTISESLESPYDWFESLTLSRRLSD